MRNRRKPAARPGLSVMFGGLGNANLTFSTYRGGWHLIYKALSALTLWVLFCR